MCDTLVSLTDGGLLFAKNSDRDPNEEQRLVWLSAADHEPGSQVATTWGEVTQVVHTHACLISQPWWMWGAEIGTNEFGVTIGNEAVFTRRTGNATKHESAGQPNDALTGMDLLRLALERSTTAHEAVGVIVELLERHGQGGPCSHEHPRFSYDNSFLIADRLGAWVLETAGSNSATEEVRGRGRSISNGLTIPSFAARFADPIRGRVARCATRQARTTAAATSANDVADLMAALRQHGGEVGGGAPQWSRLNGALGAPCAHSGGLLAATQTTASWVADLRDKPLHWATATSAPCTSVFVPIELDTEVAADLYGPTPGANTFTPRSYWWDHERVHRRAFADSGPCLARYVTDRNELERSWTAQPPPTLTALAAARALRQRWLDGVRVLDANSHTDQRPRWLRSHWRRLDQQAGFPVAG